MDLITADMLIFSTITHILFLLISFILKKHKEKHLYYKNILLSILGINLFIALIAIKLNKTHLWIFLCQGSIITAPFIYLYVNSLLEIDKISRKILIAFFTPMILSIGYSLLYYHNIVNWWYTKSDFLKINYFVFIHLLNLYIFPLFIIVIKKDFKKFRHDLKENYSCLDKIDFTHITYFINFGILSWILIYFSSYFGGNGGQSNFLFIIKYNYLIFSFMIYLFIYISGKIKPVELPDKSEKYKYAKSGIGEELLNLYYNRLVQYLEDQKPYLINKLNIDHLSKKLKISKHNLSEVINVKMNTSFFELINSYRVKEFINNLENPKYKNKTLLELAIMSGFNSKSSFNRAVKEITGLTPSELRKNQSYRQK